MNLPAYVEKAIEILNLNGYDAYAVGGCVRDEMLGITPGDYDVCTNALPEEIKKCFSDFRVILTGEKHGTVTVIIDQPIEITTFRTEGEYSDNRHPDSVSFVSDIETDLARRDFTVNAMAYSHKTGRVDPYGGARDLDNKLIRCVGDPDKRFEEDSLRIMRALRFSSVYGFEIEEETARSAKKNAHLLSKVSVERLFSEMTKLLMGKHAHAVLKKFTDVVGVIIPEILPTVGFDQHTPHHHLDVWEHILAVVEYSSSERIMRWAALLHDLGKPESYVFGTDNKGHFPGHQDTGARIADTVLKRFRCDNATRLAVVSLIANHDLYFKGEKRDMQLVIHRLGKYTAGRVMEFRIYDSMAQAPDTVEQKVAEATRGLRIFNEVVNEGLCCGINDLKIDGKALMELGVPEGKMIRNILETLLLAVIDGCCANEKEALSRYVKENIRYN